MSDTSGQFDSSPSEPRCSDEDLVAYLDGELDDERTRRIEELLAENPELNRRAAQYEQTWDLLGAISADQSQPVSAEFTQQTVSQAALSLATVEVVHPGGKLRSCRSPRWSLVAVCFIGGLFGGAAGVGRPPQYARLDQKDWAVVRSMEDLQRIPSPSFFEELVERLRELNDER